MDFFNTNIQQQKQSVNISCSEKTCTLKSVKLSCSKNFKNYSNSFSPNTHDNCILYSRVPLSYSLCFILYLYILLSFIGSLVTLPNTFLQYSLIVWYTVLIVFHFFLLGKFYNISSLFNYSTSFFIRILITIQTKPCFLGRHDILSFKDKTLFFHTWHLPFKILRECQPASCRETFTKFSEVPPPIYQSDVPFFFCNTKWAPPPLQK